MKTLLVAMFALLAPACAATTHNDADDAETDTVCAEPTRADVPVTAANKRGCWLVRVDSAHGLAYEGSVCGAASEACVVVLPAESFLVSGGEHYRLEARDVDCSTTCNP